MSDKVKILIAGDAEGKFDALFQRIETINKKSGPFDMLLCVGNFFGINNTEFSAYKTGRKKVPIPTYILGPNKDEHIQYYPKGEIEFEICENLYYLGKRGIYTGNQGLKIAYLSGIYGNTLGKTSYTAKDASDLYDICLKGNPVFRGVDILLTSQWPNGIADNLDKPQIFFGCDIPAYLCMKLKPRYMFSGLEGWHYERPPFRCPVLGDQDLTMESVTRFIGLSRVGNEKKEKWVFAIGLTPISKMNVQLLMQKTTDETPCPFDINHLESKIFGIKRKSISATQYFYDTTSTSQEQEKERRPKKQKVEFDQNKCWFCLACPLVEKHLIINVASNSYLALAKGGMVDEHFLICPIEHYQNSLAQPEDVLQEINMYKEAVQKFYSRRDHVGIFFERNYKTSHMQMQAIPIPKRALRELKQIFIDESESQGFKLTLLDPSLRLDQVVSAKSPFFTVEFPDGDVLYAKIESNMNFPLNFGREVLALGPVLNLPERADWKDCIVDKEKETDLAQKLRTAFEPFEFCI
ncbi:CWF19-like protein 1 [Aethina tumida]|uniref:CWF19-like protein 1 n=1 Tax=Aethina tumida TaxID=116153 RepID=UPI00096B59E2|nr:CWF19-like protein 1 [Aethina tumida]